MNQDLKIEHYLLQLDRALQALPVSQRAEIITEIKSHIYGVLDQDPTADLTTVLAKLGQPEQVAGRYLIEKGLPITTPSSSGRWLRGLAFAIVALFALGLISAGSVLWYLSPLIRIDKNLGRVTILGGLIDVNDELARVKVGGIEFNDALRGGVRVTGQQDVTSQNIKMVKVPFNTAQLAVYSGPDRFMRWDCKAVGHSSPKTEVDAGVMTLNLDGLNLAKCAITLPVGVASEFRGINGDMDVESPRDSLNISLANGKVEVRQDPSRVYDFEVKVKNGMQDYFPRSADKQAVKIKVDVVNGLVQKE